MQKLDMTARPARACESINRASASGGDMRFEARRRHPLLWGILLGLLILSPAVVRAQSVVDAFDPGEGASEGVLAVAAQQDGRVLIGGRFTGVAGQPIAGVARLNADGTLDPTFQPQTNGTVHTLVVQPDGKVLVGGDFTQIGGQAHDHLARLKADGTVDSSFHGGASDSVRVVATQADGRVIVGGLFTQVNGQVCNHLARLDAEGRLDIGFKPEPNGPVYAVEALADGRAYVGGEFTEAGGQVRRRVARLAAADTYPYNDMNDPSFTLSKATRTVAIQPDGRILVSGWFRNIRDQHTLIARFNSDGTQDHSFISRVDNAYSIYAIAVQPDGKILIGGDFREVESQPYKNLARLNSDGSLDTTFSSFLQPISGYADVRNIAVQPDGRILVTGTFLRSSGHPRDNLARLNADGTLDESFNPNPDGQPRSLVVQADGKILLGGGFSRVYGQERRHLARINADGTLDNSFNPNLLLGGSIFCLAVQKNGRILIGGSFSQVNGAPRMHLARLYSNGTPDEFIPSHISYPVRSITLQANGKILVGADNRIYRRLNADGTYDTTYNYYHYRFEGVRSLVLQADGRALLGSSYDLLRVLNNEAALQQLSVKLSPDGSATIVWSRGGGAPEVERVAFEVSTDGGQTYRRVGFGTPTSGGWVLNRATLPQAGHIFIRARGEHQTTIYNSSSPGIISGTATYESVLHFTLSPTPPDDPPTY